MKIGTVIVNNNVNKTDKLFDYSIPLELENVIEEGMRVLVPFGKGNRKLEAYIFSIRSITSNDKVNLKDIIRPLDDKPILSKKQIDMVYWLKEKYLCRYIEAIHCLIPAGLVNKEKRVIYLNQEEVEKNKSKFTEVQIGIIELLKKKEKVTFELLYKSYSYGEVYRAIKSLHKEGIVVINEVVESRINIIKEKYVKLAKLDKDKINLKNAKKQLDLLKILKDRQEIKLSELVNHLGFSRAVIKGLVDKGIAIIEEKEYKRDPLLNLDFKPFPKLQPTNEQEEIINKITEGIENNKSNIYLIHGITGSGKTEVYLQLIENAIKEGKQGIVLVPEISLTPQTIERFKGRFVHGIAIFHSGLSEGERYDEWRKVSNGDANIVIGARSAIFAPLNNLGLIIIDEEHETTYKSELNPKYTAFDVAKYRSEKENAIVVLGSATPSIETYHNAVQNEIILTNLKKRAHKSQIPEISIIDMRQELDGGNKSILSRTLYNELKSTLESKKQTILFLNRRGYSTFVSCRKCGYVVKCKQCDISLTFHMASKDLQCHYCGDKYQAPKICPECSSKYIKYFGTGTQKLEKVIQSYFPSASISRMDLDVTGKKGAHNKILESFKSGKIDIMIGTQMITKGLDFPNVTLVGIINADTMLNLPDFRAPEKVFQQALQVAGRAGRGIDPGKVVLQTYNPDHYSIALASKQDYKAFYNKEIGIRKAFDYPPFSKLVTIGFTGENEDEVYNVVLKITEIIKYISKSKGFNDVDTNILGPNAAMIYRIKNKYRFYILIKSSKDSHPLFKSIIKYLLVENKEKFIPKNILTSIDMNPIYTV
ncbi:primosomal protein N' [Serpentinicella sp. ANB-PHB4]|uniref:primosomal protein N' n=1 Tax=Serpentinicella sp. ANB-PHB4 TaxID=3074076 RepID=UPI002854C8E9|nr:primosomal protein N' [Serpentinicella sp. ANB-PHB4]MDR5658325.1 primosomal protein N' [Serpentinicella sp. ANB-PHB4]